MSESSHELPQAPETADYSHLMQEDSWELPGDAPLGALVDQAAAVFSARLRERDWDDSTLIDLEIGFREALINARKYGKPDGKIHVRLEAGPDTLRVVIRDDGSGFNWKNVSDPRDDANLEETHGRGIFIMREFYDTVEYNETGNEVTLQISPEGVIGEKPDNWQVRLPKRLQPSDVEIYKDRGDGLWHWHVRPEKIKDEKLREFYEAERSGRL